MAPAPPAARPPRCRLPAALLLAALVVAGCGGGGDGTPAAVASNPPAPTVPAPQPAVATPAPAPPSGAPTVDGALLAERTVAIVPAAALDAKIAAAGVAPLSAAARCDVEIVEITYASTAPGGLPVTLSGAVLLPAGAACAGPWPLVSYSRGTDLLRSRRMADPDDYETGLVAAMLGGQGYAVVATDYLGYGASATFPRHFYLHADSEASASADAVRAARRLAAARGFALDPDRLFVTGYSQGGHAAMATQRLLEQQPAEFRVTAAGHLSGPYDLPGSVRRSITALPFGELGAAYYIPFAVTSFQALYGNLYDAPARFFRAPYDATVDNLLPGTASLGALIASNRLPLLLSSLLADGFQAALDDPGSGLSAALQANSPFPFATRTPMMLCGGARDPVVDFDNARTAAAAFAAAGNPVQLIDVETQAPYRDFLPPLLAPTGLLASYHARDVPPLCLLAVRDRLFAPLR